MKHRSHRDLLVYPRTLDAAFRTPRYAAAIEAPRPSMWRRFLQHVREVFS